MELSSAGFHVLHILALLQVQVAAWPVEESPHLPLVRKITDVLHRIRVNTCAAHNLRVFISTDYEHLDEKEATLVRCVLDYSLSREELPVVLASQLSPAHETQHWTAPSPAWQTVDKSFQLNYNPKPLLDLLEHRLWRTCMYMVKHELGIPPQTEVVHRQKLSNVEALYYREEHIKCHNKIFDLCKLEFCVSSY
ncbi:uncharacterized protein LOC117580882 [Drosophila guanche]|uniref:uncharacterized protein LOC117580882 n=1 Tax=Drosophila guanche TaxID=7266 RepID=UPI0014714751|nr:uncharacterized protein LOC117580882 [Drosophila guanche]